MDDHGGSEFPGLRRHAARGGVCGCRYRGAQYHGLQHPVGLRRGGSLVAAAVWRAAHRGGLCLSGDETGRRPHTIYQRVAGRAVLVFAFENWLHGSPIHKPAFGLELLMKFTPKSLGSAVLAVSLAGLL